MNAVALLEFEFAYFQTDVQHFSRYVMGTTHVCNIIAEGFRFIYLAVGFSEAENLSAQCMG